MIVHLKLNEVADVSIGVTAKMQRDMVKCDEGLKSECYPDCKECSWNDITFGAENFCTIPEIRAMVIGKKGDVNVQK